MSEFRQMLERARQWYTDWAEGAALPAGQHLGDERNGQGEVESVLDRPKRVRVRTGHYKGRQSPYWAGQVEAESVLGRTSRGRVRTGQDKEIQSPY